MCKKGLNKAFGEKLFNFMLFSFRYLVLCQPTPLHSHAFVVMHSIMFAMGVCGSSEACMCNKGLNQAFGKKLFNFMLLNSGYFVLFQPTPLRLQEIVAMHSVKLAMGSAVQKKLASAIRV